MQGAGTHVTGCNQTSVKMRGISVTLIFAFLSFSVLTAKRYDGFQVLTLTPNTEAHIDLLKNLQSLPDVEFWDEDIRMGREVEILVPGSISKWLNNIPSAQGASVKVINDDIQASIDGERQRMEARHNDPSVDNYDPEDYNTYEDILERLVYLVNQCPPTFNCEYRVVGRTVEGRDIVVFRLTKDGENRKSVWIDSLIHAREWLAGSTTMLVLEKLVTEYGIDDDVTRLLDAFNFYVLPVHNADGYSYSWETERFWRKSRNVNEGSSCMGTDLNRNFDISWSGIGTSPDPCSDTFHGSSAASEPETQAVQDQILSLADETIAWLTIHTAAMAWLTPWGDVDENGACTYPEDYADIDRALVTAMAAVEETHATLWRWGNSCEVLYATTGSTQDFAKVNGIKYSYTPELRGPGFSPGQTAIPRSYEETWNGIAALLFEIAAIEGYDV